MSAEHDKGKSEIKVGDGPVKILLLSQWDNNEKQKQELEGLIQGFPNLHIVNMTPHDPDAMAAFVKEQTEPFTVIIDATNTNIASIGGHGAMYRISLESALGQQRAKEIQENSDEFSTWFSNHTNEPFIYLNPESQSASEDLHSLLVYYNGR